MTAHPQPLPPATPPDAIAEVVRDKVILGEHTFLIDKPGGSDDLFAHPAVRAAFAADEYLPYWADLWPAARMLAKAVLAEPWPPGLTALEIGCGLGLPGIAHHSRSGHEARVVGRQEHDSERDVLSDAEPPTGETPQ